ncbi:hypothetical protein F8388_020343 [Cannabis sativa]|uniref:DUF1985 domain-containing protein n=1 Tax=Cannabis sativa TaxID=3483 RepID=A0A7J6HIH2_CANSA|nr:hypothetical protein F8388_020343 [Cannabis sativa]
MGNIKWNIALPHLALVREVHQGREDLEKWFLIRDRVVRFGLEEFVLITGLSLKGSSDLNEFKQKMSFKKKIFPDLTIKVIQEQVRARFLSGEFDDDVDAVKMAIVFLLSHYLYGYENGKKVDNELFGFVDGDLSELRNIAFGKLLWDRTFHYMNLAFKDGDNIYYKIEKAKEEKDKLYSFKFQGFPFAFLIWLFEILPSLSPNYCKRIANTYPRMLNWESTYKKKPGFSKLGKALVCIQEDQKKILLSIKNLKDEFSMKFDEVIELLKSKKGSSVPKDFEEKVEDSCSENLDVGGNDDEFSDPPSLEKSVVSKSKLPKYDDDEGGLQLSLVREDKIVIQSGLGEGRDEGCVFSYETIKVDQSILDLVDSLTRAYASPISAKNDQWDLVSIPEFASPTVDDDVEVLDVLPLQSSVAVKRQAKPKLHYKSPFLNEFGSSEPKDQNKKEMEPSCELEFDPKELNNEKIAGDIDPPFDFSIAQINDKSWFVILQTCGEELFDLHLNVTLYYLRKSILFDASVNKRVMTTCTYFVATIKGVYADFIKAKRDLNVIKYDNMVTDYILGQYNFCFQPWISVDDVVGPCHVGLQQHWIFLHFSILRRKIFVFNSMKNKKTNQKKILPDLLASPNVLCIFNRQFYFCSSPQHSRKLTIPISRIQLLHEDMGFHLARTGYIHMFCPGEPSAFAPVTSLAQPDLDPPADTATPFVSTGPPSQGESIDFQSWRRRSEAAIVAEARSSVDKIFDFGEDDRSCDFLCSSPLEKKKQVGQKPEIDEEKQGGLDVFEDAGSTDGLTPDCCSG